MCRKNYLHIYLNIYIYIYLFIVIAEAPPILSAELILKLNLLSTKKHSIVLSALRGSHWNTQKQWLIYKICLFFVLSNIIYKVWVNFLHSFLNTISIHYNMLECSTCKCYSSKPSLYSNFLHTLRITTFIETHTNTLYNEKWTKSVYLAQ